MFSRWFGSTTVTAKPVKAETSSAGERDDRSSSKDSSRRFSSIESGAAPAPAACAPSLAGGAALARAKAAGKKPMTAKAPNNASNLGVGEATTHVLTLIRVNLEESFGLALVGERARVVAVDDGGPAHRCGVEPLDRILTIDGEPTSADIVPSQIASKRAVAFGKRPR